eukprot:CAMPEP_0184719192 /NCGR_PEP_ID=MMETSP0314-20130426/8177_1 /TAXON_ID=38298 /ORGANISM="Rhodella maculata, Strain CCMP 736" /LENGTH=370 /DNA_ID=CAMNT_0027183047 /DNA_START=6 /DNA_END=1118 /DNA_ORIENTATION=-
MAFVPITSPITVSEKTIQLTGRRREVIQLQKSKRQARLHMTGAETSPEKGTVVGLGTVSIDYLAYVDSFPNPDDKIRAKLEVFGGGNAANTLTALARLGVPTSLVTAVGNDSNGSSIISELEADGVGLEFLTRVEGPSPFTYIIVDKAGTRTCIHTPAERGLQPDDIVGNMLHGASVLHLDGRHTEAAIALAKQANARNIPVTLDVEKDRPFLEQLLPLADHIITNSRYPFLFSPESCNLFDAMEELRKATSAKSITTTLGKDGCAVLFEEAASESDFPPQVQSVNDPQGRFIFSCAAEAVPHIVDTTGAGDAFIAGIICGIWNNPANYRKGVLHGARLGAKIAACKIQVPGARRGLPFKKDIDSRILEC